MEVPEKPSTFAAVRPVAFRRFRRLPPRGSSRASLDAFDATRSFGVEPFAAVWARCSFHAFGPKLRSQWKFLAETRKILHLFNG